MIAAIAIARAKGESVTTAVAKRRSVLIERVGKKLLDVDNLAAGATGLVNALRYAHLIVDDSPRWCDLRFGQRVTGPGEKPHTVVTIEEAP